MRQLRIFSLVVVLCLIVLGRAYAQTVPDEDTLRVAVASELETANIPHPENYSPYAVHNIHIEESWALFNVVSAPVAYPKDARPPANILLGFAYWDGGTWRVFIEFTPEYYQQLNSVSRPLPEWLNWLKQREEQVQSAQPNESVSVPALPYVYGHAWRYTSGPHFGHNPAESIDFAPWPAQVPSAVYSVEAGTVVAVGEPDSKPDPPENCLTVERTSDKMKVYYLHVNENDVNRFRLGSPVKVGQFIGYTSLSQGCTGAPDGHHIHIEFRRVLSPYPINADNWYSMGGSSFNDWKLADASKFPVLLTKGTAVVTETHTGAPADNPMYNRVGSSDPNCPINISSGAVIYTGYKCDGSSYTFAGANGGTYLENVGKNNSINSIAIAPGWHVILHDVDPSQGNRTCLYGSVTDLRDYTYPGSAMIIAGTPSAIEVYNKGICPAKILEPVFSPACHTSSISASSVTDDCTPRDLTPPSATGYSVSIQDGTANLVADGVSDSGGSGIQRVQFSAKWNNEWRVVGSTNSSPYVFSWNMCASGTPDGQIEFGLEVWDNDGNNFVWSQHANNPLANKFFNCNPSGGTSTGSIKLFSLANYEGSIVWSGETGFSNSPNFDSYSLQIPSGWSVKIWRGDNRSGEMRCFSSSVSNLQDHGWQLAIQSIEGFSSNVCGTANTGYVVMCADNGCWQFGQGYHSMPSYGSGWNDIMTKVTNVPSNMSVMLFREGLSRGSVECYNNPQDPLPSGQPHDMFKQVTDAYVFDGQNCPITQHGNVLFNSDRNFGGYTWSAGKGPSYINMSNLGSQEWFNDAAESIRIPPGKSVVLYVHDSKEGDNSGCLTGEVGDLGSFNNKVSSVEIFDNTSCQPTAPTNLQVVYTTPTSLWLAWNHPAMGDVAFKIYRWNGSDFTFLFQTDIGSNSFIDENLPCNSDQFYKLSAVTGRGESPQIGWIQAKTDLCPYPSQPSLEIEGGKRTVVEGEPIYFGWTESANATEYLAELKGADTYSSGWQDGNKWVAFNVKPTIYIFQVTARNQRGEAYSDMQFIYVKVAAPELGAIDSETCSSNRIYWRDNSEYEEKFFVRRGGQIISEVASVPGQSEYSYLDEGLAESGSYTYTIEALSPGSSEGSFQNGFSETRTGVVRKCAVAPVAATLDTPINGTVFEAGQVVTFSWSGGTAQYYELSLTLIGGATQVYVVGDTSYSQSDLQSGQYQWSVKSVTDLGDISSQVGTFSIKEAPQPPPPPSTYQLYLPLIEK